MEDKMIKDFDRAIEQMMNEHAVAPPFGAWNRIAAELDSPAAAPVAARSAFPVAAVGGFVAGALLIGGLVASVLVYNAKGINNITYPTASISAQIPTSANNNTALVPVVEQKDNIASASNELVLEAEKIAVTSKPVAIPKQAKGTEKNTNIAATANQLLTNNNDVAVPSVKVTSNGKAVSMPYYFPPIDINAGTDSQNVEADANGTDIADNAADAKTNSTEVKKRTSSSVSEFRGVKFKKRSNRKARFTYGNIVRVKKH